MSEPSSEPTSDRTGKRPAGPTDRSSADGDAEAMPAVDQAGLGRRGSRGGPGHDAAAPTHLLAHRIVGDQAHAVRRDRPPVGRRDPGAGASPQPDADDSGADAGTGVTSSAEAATGRPLIERIGMVGIALVLAALFAGVATAAFSGGEPFLAVMAAIGCLMTLWAGALTLFRG